MAKSRREIWKAIGLNGGNVNKMMEHRYGNGSIGLQILREFSEREGLLVVYLKGD